MTGEKEGMEKHCPCTHQIMSVVAEAAGSVSVSELLSLVKMSVRLCLLPVCLDVCLFFTCFCLSVHLSACLQVCLFSVCLSICLTDTDLIQISSSNMSSKMQQRKRSEHSAYARNILNRELCLIKFNEHVECKELAVLQVFFSVFCLTFLS